MNLRRLMKASFVWGGFLLSFVSYGQLHWKLSDRGQRLPLGALPMQYNGSFAGEASGPRINSSFSFLSNTAANQYSVYDLFVSYDQFIPAIRTGIGMTAGRSDQAGNSSYINNYGNGYNSFSLISLDFRTSDYFLSVAIAPKFSLKGKYTLSPSIDFTYRPGSTTVNSITTTPTNTILNDWGYSYNHHQWQSRIGLLFNTCQFYVGYSVYLLNRDTFSTRNKTTAFPAGQDTTYSFIRTAGFPSYLQMGYTFQQTSQSKFSVTPQLVLGITDYTNTYPPRLLNNHYVHVEAINLNFKYQQLIFGLNNRGWHVGWQTDQLKVMVSNNFDSGYYSGNLSLRYLIKNTSSQNYHTAY